MGGSTELAQRIRDAAVDEGFDHLAVAAAGDSPAAIRLREWLERGMHGSMAWLERNVDRRCDPRLVVDGARSIVVVARRYWTGDPIDVDARHARFSRYAWGDDYHDVMTAAIRRLQSRIEALSPGATGRSYVDTGPVTEKAWAQLAGLGWIGKHTNLISVGEGSWMFLGALLLDIEMEAGSPARNHCGSCSACIDVCPTGAIVAPYVLDARLCIAYLTIENRGPIPRHLRTSIGNHVFGCDDCQDVCPWNRFARLSTGAARFAPRALLRAAPLVELLAIGREEFRERFRGTPVRRARHDGFRRNVAVAIGNSGDAGAVPGLIAEFDTEASLVRGHIAWALGQLGGPHAIAALQRRRDQEADPWVNEEIVLALACAANG